MTDRSLCRGKRLALVCTVLAALVAMIVIMMPSAAAVGQTTEAPTIDMYVGDTFVYVAEVNLDDSVIWASGDGLVGAKDGAFLIFDPLSDTLYGTPTTAGSYTVILTAVWTMGDLRQETEQIITFNVSEAPIYASSTDYNLTYDASNDDWLVITTQPGASDIGTQESGFSLTKILLIALAAIVCAAVLRVIL